MTREDLTWIAARLVSLWLLVDALAAAPDAIAAFMDSGLSEAEAWRAKVRALAPMVGALALFEGTRRRPAGSGQWVADVRLGGEDLLWVCCKAFGLYLIVVAIGFASTFASFVLTGSGFGDGSLSMLAGLLVHAALGGWLFFGDRLWRYGVGRRGRDRAQ